jgi:hypothetical protein
MTERVYVSLVKKEKKECKTTSWQSTWVLDLIYKCKGEYLPILIKDLIDGDDENILKQAKQKAREYFINKHTADVW